MARTTGLEGIAGGRQPRHSGRGASAQGPGGGGSGCGALSVGPHFRYQGAPLDGPGGPKSGTGWVASQGKAGAATPWPCVVEVRRLMGHSPAGQHHGARWSPIPASCALTVRPSILRYHSDEVAAKAWQWRSWSALPSGTGKAPGCPGLSMPMQWGCRSAGSKQERSL